MSDENIEDYAMLSLNGRKSSCMGNIFRPSFADFNLKNV